MKGTLFGLGVGPGDPELLTLKAVRILSSVSVIAYPATETGESFAREIAKDYIPDNLREIIIRTPMNPNRFPEHDVYDKYSHQIRNYLDEGADVAVLCEGDPFLYGSFMYIFSRLSEVYATQVIPGVSSIGACAAVSGRPLVSRNEVLSVIPATLKSNDLSRHINSAEAIAIMKVGRHFEKVKAVLEKLGLDQIACYIEYASMRAERVLPLKDAENIKAPYFSMILVRSRKEIK